jgi:hypothetical protein
MTHIPPLPVPAAWRPLTADENCTPGQLRARANIRLAIASQDLARGDTLAYQRNVAEATRLERLIEGAQGRQEAVG